MIAMRRSTIIRPEVEPRLGCVHRLTLLALIPLEAHQTQSLKLASESWILCHFYLFLLRKQGVIYGVTYSDVEPSLQPD